MKIEEQVKRVTAFQEMHLRLACSYCPIYGMPVPLSVDFERGYADAPEAVKENATKLLVCGVVGFNIEDGLADGSLQSIEIQCKKNEALAELKAETGIPFVINARTCAIWLNVAGEKESLDLALARGNAYRKAGADCIFVPGLLNEETIIQLVNGIQSPINTIPNPKFHDIESLRRIGIRRLSVGSGPVRSVFNHRLVLAENLSAGGTADMMNSSFGYGKANDFFSRLIVE